MYIAVAYRTATKTKEQEDNDEKDEGRPGWNKRRKAENKGEELDSDYESTDRELDVDVARAIKLEVDSLL